MSGLYIYRLREAFLGHFWAGLVFAFSVLEVVHARRSHKRYSQYQEATSRIWPTVHLLFLLFYPIILLFLPLILTSSNFLNTLLDPLNAIL